MHVPPKPDAIDDVAQRAAQHQTQRKRHEFLIGAQTPRVIDDHPLMINGTMMNTTPRSLNRPKATPVLAT